MLEVETGVGSQEETEDHDEKVDFLEDEVMLHDDLGFHKKNLIRCEESVLELRVTRLEHLEKVDMLHVIELREKKKVTLLENEHHVLKVLDLLLEQRKNSSQMMSLLRLHEVTTGVSVMHQKKNGKRKNQKLLEMFHHDDQKQIKVNNR
jgi:saccharopine dehydrogenase-like NADP-dependent oxidoreductase